MGWFSSCYATISSVEKQESKHDIELKKMQSQISKAKAEVEATKRSIMQFSLHSIRINTHAIGKIRSDEEFWSDVNQLMRTRVLQQDNINGVR